MKRCLNCKDMESNKRIKENFIQKIGEDVLIIIGIEYLNMLLLEEDIFANRMFLKFILLNKRMFNIMKLSIKKSSFIIPTNWGVQIWTIKNNISSTLVIPYWRDKFENLTTKEFDLIKILEINQVSISSLLFISKLTNLEELIMIKTEQTLEKILSENREKIPFLNYLIKDQIELTKLNHVHLGNRRFIFVFCGNIKTLEISYEIGKDNIIREKAPKKSKNIKELILHFVPEFYGMDAIWTFPLLEVLIIKQQIILDDHQERLENWISPSNLPELKNLNITFDFSCEEDEIEDFIRYLTSNYKNLNIRYTKSEAEISKSDQNILDSIDEDHENQNIFDTFENIIPYHEYAENSEKEIPNIQKTNDYLSKDESSNEEN